MEHVKARHVGRAWFTSDLMLGSERDAEHRNHDSADQMNSVIADRWNELVKPYDTVWILGNLIGGQSDETRSAAFGVAQRLNGTKYLLAGPLDPCLSGQYPYAAREAVRYRELAGLKAVVTGKEFVNDDTAPQRRRVPIQIPLLGGASHGHPNVMLSAFHYPEPGARDDDFARYRPRWEKRRAEQSPYLIHGEAPWVVRDYPPGKAVNVSMDAWGFEPVSAEMVADMLRSD